MFISVKEIWRSYEEETAESEGGRMRRKTEQKWGEKRKSLAEEGRCR